MSWALSSTDEGTLSEMLGRGVRRGGGTIDRAARASPSAMMLLRPARLGRSRSSIASGPAGSRFTGNLMRGKHARKGRIFVGSSTRLRFFEAVSCSCVRRLRGHPPSPARRSWAGETTPPPMSRPGNPWTRISGEDWLSSSSSVGVAGGWSCVLRNESFPTSQCSRALLGEWEAFPLRQLGRRDSRQHLG